MLTSGEDEEKRKFEIYGIDENDERWSQRILRWEINTKIERHGNETDITAYSILDKSGILYVFWMGYKDKFKDSLIASVVIKGAKFRKRPICGAGFDISRENEKPFSYTLYCSHHGYSSVLDLHVNKLKEAGGIYEEDEKCVIVAEFGNRIGRVGVQYRPCTPSQPVKERHIYTRPNYYGATFGNMIDTIYGDEILSEFVRNYRHAERVKMVNICSREREDFTRFFSNSVHKKLKKNTEDHPVVFIRPIKVENEEEFKYNLICMFYDNFEVRKLFIVNRAQAALYRTGNSTGLVVHIGSRKSYVVLIIDGNIKSTFESKNICGDEITRLFFLKMNPDKVIDLDRWILKQDYYAWIEAESAKEKLCYIPTSAEKSGDREDSGIFKRENGEEVRFGNEMHEYPERVLFGEKEEQSRLENMTIRAIESIEEEDEEVRKEVAQNIVLSGSTTSIDGFSERFEEELMKLECDVDIRVISTSDRSDSSWVGGSLFASMCMNQPGIVEKKFIPYEVYDDHGPEFEGYGSCGNAIFEHFHPKCMDYRYGLKKEDEDLKERVEFLKVCFMSGKMMNKCDVMLQTTGNDVIKIPRFLLN